jgi:hypothetical protein
MAILAIWLEFGFSRAWQSSLSLKNNSAVQCYSEFVGLFAANFFQVEL